MPAPHEIVSAPDAVLGRPDPTRRWAVRVGGTDTHPGLTRPEAEAAGPVLAAMGAADAGRALVRVELPVVLSDGAGPHLADADGLLVLVLGAHRGIADAWVAMGQPGPDRDRMGLVAPVGGGGVWRWRARAEVPVGERIRALDALDGLPGPEGLDGWTRRWAGRRGAPG